MTIFLIRSEKVAALKEFETRLNQRLPLADNYQGAFYPFPAPGTQPSWARAIVSLLADARTDVDLRASSPAGLLSINSNGLQFVVSFGHAWQKLDPTWLVRDFGRRVALNTISTNKILELRTEQVFARWHLASERAPKATAVNEFNVEFDRDLVSVIEGAPDEVLLGKIIRGGTSLRVNAPLDDLARILKLAEKLYTSSNYKAHWPEIDNLAPVEDPEVEAALEQHLDGELAAGKGKDKVLLIPPSLFAEDGPSVESFVLGRMSKNPPLMPFLTFDEWEIALRRAKGSAKPSVDAAKRMSVHLLDEANAQLRAVDVYDFFAYEATISGKQYVLSSRAWYEANVDFIKQTNAYLASIQGLAKKNRLTPWNGTDNEGKYNTGAENQAAGLHNVDAKNVGFGGGKSRFEVCDLLDPNNQILYFVKNVKRSQGMSHLTEQARRTAELLFGQDGTYRAKLKAAYAKKCPKVPRAWLDSKPDRSKWKLCLVSMGREANELPFFAKCGLVRCHKDLVKQGYQVHFITV